MTLPVAYNHGGQYERLFDYSPPSSRLLHSPLQRSSPLPIPPLTSHGLLPGGVYDCTLSEIEDVYVYNERRRRIWAGFTRYCNKLRTVGELNIIHVDGGFVTDKVEPKDVDVVITFSDMAALTRLATAHRFLRDRDFVKSGFYVDMLHWTPVLPPGAEDLIEYFQTLRPRDAIERGVSPGTRKGILRVSIRA